MSDDGLWILGRASGVMSLVLLTVVVVLGIAAHGARPVAGLPRFGVVALHRSASLLGTAFVATHTVSLLLDPFAKLSVIALVVPLTAAREPLWYGLGAVSLDLLLALMITSLLRTRLPLSVWRGVHLAAYAFWPVAVVHGLMSGSDAGSTWMIAVVAAAVLAVLVAVGIRLARLRRPAPVPAPTADPGTTRTAVRLPELR